MNIWNKVCSGTIAMNTYSGCVIREDVYDDSSGSNSVSLVFVPGEWWYGYDDNKFGPIDREMTEKHISTDE